MMSKREVIYTLMQGFDRGKTSVTVERWTFVFNPFSGYAAANLSSVRSYSSFDDLAGMVEDMFNDGCFND